MMKRNPGIFPLCKGARGTRGEDESAQLSLDNPNIPKQAYFPLGFFIFESGIFRLNFLFGSEQFQ